MAVWQMVAMRRVYASWKKCLLQTEDGSAARKIRFVRQLHLALALNPYHNSFRQQRSHALADAFLLRRLLLPAWLCLYEDLHLTRIAELKLPMAVAHHDRQFFLRVSKVSS